MNVSPSGPATGSRVLSGSKRRMVPACTGTSSPSTRYIPLPPTTTTTSSWPVPVSSCSRPAVPGESSNQLMPKACAPSSRPTNRTAPPGPAGAISATSTTDQPTGLGHQVVRHRLEHLHVGVHGGVVVRDGQGPLLLAPRRHEHAAVHVVQPRELGEVLVLVGLERLVVDDLDRRERHAALGARADRVAREVVLADDGLAAGEDAVVQAVEVRVGVRGQHL